MTTDTTPGGATPSPVETTANKVAEFSRRHRLRYQEQIDDLTRLLGELDDYIDHQEPSPEAATAAEPAGAVANDETADTDEEVDIDYAQRQEAMQQFRGVAADVVALLAAQIRGDAWDLAEEYWDLQQRLEGVLYIFEKAPAWENVVDLPEAVNAVRDNVFPVLDALAKGEREPEGVQDEIRGDMNALGRIIRAAATEPEETVPEPAEDQEPAAEAPVYVVRPAHQIIRDIEAVVRPILADRAFWGNPALRVGEDNVQTLARSLLKQMRAVRPQDGAAMGTYNLESLPQIHADLPALRDAMEVQFLAAIPDAGSRSRVASALHTTRTLMDGAMDRMNVPQGRVRTIVNTVSAGILATLVAWGGCRYIGPSAKRVERGSAPPPAGAGSQLPPSGEQGSRPPRAGESNSTSPPPSGAEQGSRPPRAATAPIDARIPKESASLGVPGRTHKFDVSASGGKLTVKFPDDVDPADVVLFVGLPNTKPQSVVPPNGTARGAKWDVALPTALNGAPVIGVGVSEYIGNSPQPTHGSLQLMKLN